MHCYTNGPWSETDRLRSIVCVTSNFNSYRLIIYTCGLLGSRDRRGNQEEQRNMETRRMCQIYAVCTREDWRIRVRSPTLALTHVHTRRHSASFLVHSVARILLSFKARYTSIAKPVGTHASGLVDRHARARAPAERTGAFSREIAGRVSERNRGSHECNSFAYKLTGLITAESIN